MNAPDRDSPRAASNPTSAEHPDALSQPRAVFLAFLLPTLLAATLVLATALKDSVFAASQVITELVYPIGLLWLGLLGSAVYCLLRRRKVEFWLFAVGWLWVTVTCNGTVAGRMMNGLMWSPDALKAQPAQPYRCVVLLGGGAVRNDLGVAELNGHGQRVFFAAQLYYAGKTSAIVCTGESEIENNDPSEVTVEMLRSIGIPAEALYIVGGRNTKEEMASLRTFFDNPPAGLAPNGQVGLVTSAFHMPRAMRLAESQSLEFLPLPVNFRASYHQPGIRDLIPSAGAGGGFGQALKEYIAPLVGR